jgi:GNAT-family acetyltransferase (TIGR03103 family)
MGSKPNHHAVPPREPGGPPDSRDRQRSLRLKAAHRLPDNALGEKPDGNASIHCGWGRLIFADTFSDSRSIVETLCDEARGQRDIVFYVTSPHVALSMAPQQVFLDPSHTFRLWLANYRPSRQRPQGFVVRRLRNRSDAEGVNRIYAKANMVPVPTDFMLENVSSRRLTYLVAEDKDSHEIVGTVTGVDHYRAYKDPQRGASLWCLAADLQARNPGIGEALLRQLAEHYIARGRNFMDLSVMHDNEAAIALYERLGFERIPQFALKRKNVINERLFTGAEEDTRLNPYARIIVAEARRRGIGVECEDEPAGLFRLSLGGRTIACRESLSDLTTAVAVQRCDDKALTLRLLARAGVSVPNQMEAGDDDANAAFLRSHGRIVVKPARGEQGAGITVDVRDEAAMKTAIERAARVSTPVLLEQFVEGEDLRIIVIDGRVVAAAVRRAASVTGNGKDDLRKLIEKRSRRRAKATGGESRIPIDGETERCVALAGYAMDSVPEKGEVVTVRKTANLHTGGTIHDVTDQLHPALVEAAMRGAKALSIPVVGFDLLVPDLKGPDYVIIEANERPGLANHEPQPTAERFVDLLFPQTASGRS